MDGCCCFKAFHLSTSSFMASRTRVSSAMSDSTDLNSAPISDFSESMSRAPSAAASRASSAARFVWYSSIRLGTAHALLGLRRHGALERDAIGAREHAIDVEDDHQLVIHFRDSLQEIG